MIRQLDFQLVAVDGRIVTGVLPGGYPVRAGRHDDTLKRRSVRDFLLVNADFCL